MTVDAHDEGARGPRRLRGILTTVFVLVLAVFLFWLARTMVIHRFYRGGAQEQNQIAP
ncbi:MAG TPA: hypothetical protein VHX60_03455 [Acidobacteriaceae bacterium]|nr:hypothetical protein [Acidobacteriaceae bacterium]